jgi:hypothetical protein
LAETGAALPPLPLLPPLPPLLLARRHRTEALAVVVIDNHPVLCRALVAIIESVEQAILDTQRERGDGRHATATLN